MTVQSYSWRNPKRFNGRQSASRVRTLVGTISLLLAIPLKTGIGIAQQASTSAAPLFNANSKYVQGVGPGYWPTPGAGLLLNLAAGTSMCGSPQGLVTYNGGTLTMTASQTNYVYLDPSLSCAPSANTTGFTSGQIPLAKVVTNVTTISAITDARTWFVPQPIGTDATGKAVTKYLNSFRMADQFMGPNNIASAITDAGSNPSTIIAPGSLSSSAESVCGAGFVLNQTTGCTNGNNTQVWDFRNGFSASANDPTGNMLNTSANFKAWNQWTANYTAPESFPMAGMDVISNLFNQKVFDGGVNLNAPGYGFNKTTWTGIYVAQRNFAQGQAVPLGILNYHTGVGDSLGMSISASCAGGRNQNGDEGCKGADFIAAQIPNEYQGTISAGAGTGSTALTIAVTQSGATQGSGRWLVDVQSPYTTGTISSTSGTDNQGAGYPTLLKYVGAGTGWTPNTVLALTTTAVTTLGSQSVSVGSFARGANLNGITDGTTPLIVADGSEFEVVKSSAHTGTSFTAIFTKPHPSGSVVSIGAGGSNGPYFIELVSDEVSALTTGTDKLRWYWPVLYVSTATTLVPWFSSAGTWSLSGINFIGHGVATGYSNAYSLVPGAEIISVQFGGSVSQTLNPVTLAANNVVWGNGDLVDQPQYPGIGLEGHENWLTKYFPPSQGASALIDNELFGSGWASPDTGILFLNNDVGPDGTHSEYQEDNDATGNSAAKFAPPSAVIDVRGRWLIGLKMQVAPAHGIVEGSGVGSGSAVWTGCPPKGDGTTALDCTRNIAYNLLLQQTALTSGFDALSYNASTGIYKLTAGGAASGYSFNPGSFSLNPIGDLGTANLPFANVWVGNAATNNVKITAGGLSAPRVWSFPDLPSDTFVGRSTTDTLSNKTLTSPVINGGMTSTGAITLAAGGTNQNVTLTPSGTGFTILNGSVGIGNSTPAQKLDVSGALRSALNTVTFSATPAFNASLGNTQKITLTGAVTSSTLTSASAGEQINFIICQDATGSRAFVWPTNVLGGMTIGSTASKCSAQTFVFDGTNAYALSAGLAGM